ncbi:hypothetical protein F5Y06DRAFT_301350 [Hypoxylon sp. FL0890]|nr:hypothetical protein F5Y06DRAFT_301350 [Hypoxylon sp. FL0890]
MLGFLWRLFKLVPMVALRMFNREKSSTTYSRASEVEAQASEVEDPCNSTRRLTGPGAHIQSTTESAGIGDESSSDVIEVNSRATKIAELSATIDSLRHNIKQESQLRVKAETEVQQLSSKLKTVQTKWKRTASKLDQILSQAQVFNTVTDEELVSMVRQLQYNIRGFAVQYFSEPFPDFGLMPKPNYADYLPERYILYLRRSENCPTIVQSFVWHVLASEVFDQFRWAGCASGNFDALWDHIAHARIRESQATAIATQKLHAWRATTTGLVLDSLNERDTSTNQELKAIIMHEMRMVLSKISKQAYESELDNILDAAINLDKIISSQAAKISWRFLDLQDGEHARKELLSNNIKGLVVVSPTMVKRGKSNGEDFDTESVLLPKVEEFCKKRWD